MTDHSANFTQLNNGKYYFMVIWEHEISKYMNADTGTYVL